MMNVGQVVRGSLVIGVLWLGCHFFSPEVSAGFVELALYVVPNLIVLTIIVSVLYAAGMGLAHWIQYGDKALSLKDTPPPQSKEKQKRGRRWAVTVTDDKHMRKWPVDGGPVELPERKLKRREKR